MNDQKDDGLLKVILYGGLGYGIYLAVTKVIDAVAQLLQGLVMIVLVVASVVALLWLYRYITDKQYGVQKKTRLAEKWERERKATISRLPKHLREHADQYFQDRQRGLFELKSESRLDVILERIKKLFGKGGEQ